MSVFPYDEMSINSLPFLSVKGSVFLSGTMLLPSAVKGKGFFNALPIVDAVQIADFYG